MIFHARLRVKIKLDFSHSSQRQRFVNIDPNLTPKLQDVFSIKNLWENLFI